MLFVVLLVTFGFAGVWAQEETCGKTKIPLSKCMECEPDDKLKGCKCFPGFSGKKCDTPCVECFDNSCQARWSADTKAPTICIKGCADGYHSGSNTNLDYIKPILKKGGSTADGSNFKLWLVRGEADGCGPKSTGIEARVRIKVINRKSRISKSKMVMMSLGRERNDRQEFNPKVFVGDLVPGQRFEARAVVEYWVTGKKAALLYTASSKTVKFSTKGTSNGCPPMRWGPKCDKMCTPRCGMNSCSRTKGCKCPMGRYGPDCEMICEECFAASCQARFETDEVVSNCALGCNEGFFERDEYEVITPSLSTLDKGVSSSKVSLLSTFKRTKTKCSSTRTGIRTKYVIEVKDPADSVMVQQEDSITRGDDFIRWDLPKPDSAVVIQPDTTYAIRVGVQYFDENSPEVVLSTDFSKEITVTTPAADADPCDSGMWGENCDKKCSASCPGGATSCDKMLGCACDEKTWGPGCMRSADELCFGGLVEPTFETFDENPVCKLGCADGYHDPDDMKYLQFDVMNDTSKKGVPKEKSFQFIAKAFRFSHRGCKRSGIMRKTVAMAFNMRSGEKLYKMIPDSDWKPAASQDQEVTIKFDSGVFGNSPYVVTICAKYMDCQGKEMKMKKGMKMCADPILIKTPDKAKCPNTDICPTTRDLVCANNGRTYLNSCWLNKAACRNPEVAQFATGPCPFGVLCPGDLITCEGEEEQEVCGSDGKTYKNICELEKRKCRMRDLYKAGDGECPKDCESGYWGAMCDNVCPTTCPSVCDRYKGCLCERGSYGMTCSLQCNECQDRMCQRRFELDSQPSVCMQGCADGYISPPYPYLCPKLIFDEEKDLGANTATPFVIPSWRMAKTEKAGMMMAKAMAGQCKPNGNTAVYQLKLWDITACVNAGKKKCNPTEYLYPGKKDKGISALSAPRARFALTDLAPENDYRMEAASWVKVGKTLEKIGMTKSISFTTLAEDADAGTSGLVLDGQCVGGAFWGENCDIPCPLFCESCDRVKGCACPKGWYGEGCTKGCEECYNMDCGGDTIKKAMFETDTSKPTCNKGCANGFHTATSDGKFKYAKPNVVQDTSARSSSSAWIKVVPSRSASDDCARSDIQQVFEVTLRGPGLGGGVTQFVKGIEGSDSTVKFTGLKRGKNTYEATAYVAYFVKGTDDPIQRVGPSKTNVKTSAF